MTAIISDWIDALRDTFKPGSAKGSWNLGTTIGKFYKRMIIPLILVIIVDILIIPWALGSLAGMGMSTGVANTAALVYIEVMTIIIAFLVAAPISFLIQGVMYHIFGQMTGAVTKGSYSDTVSAVMHSAMPGIALYFVVISIVWVLVGTVGSSIGAILGIALVVLIIAIWQLVVFLYSFAAIHKTTKTKAFLTWLVPFIIGIIVLIATAILIGAYANILSGALGAAGISTAGL